MGSPFETNDSALDDSPLNDSLDAGFRISIRETTFLDKHVELWVSCSLEIAVPDVSEEC
jgi:hypothetical protein